MPKKRPTLIHQSHKDVTVKAGEVPLIHCGANTQFANGEHVQRIVNFLRSDVPAVQISYETNEKSMWADFCEDLEDRLVAMGEGVVIAVKKKSGGKKEPFRLYTARIERKKPKQPAR